jgi:hypothetical protein
LRLRWNRDFYIYEIYEIYEFSMFSIYNITWGWLKSTWPSVVRSLILSFCSKLRIGDFDEIEIFIYTKYTKYPNFRCFQYIIYHGMIKKYVTKRCPFVDFEILKYIENLRFRWNRDCYIYKIYEIPEFSMFSIYNITWDD